MFIGIIVLNSRHDLITFGDEAFPYIN